MCQEITDKLATSANTKGKQVNIEKNKLMLKSTANVSTSLAINGGLVEKITMDHQRLATVCHTP